MRFGGSETAAPWGDGDSTDSVGRLGWRSIEMRYGLIIYWSGADSAFLVEVPELPGCMADGATYEEAEAANAQAVISGWLETATALGRPIPEPAGKRDFFQT